MASYIANCIYNQCHRNQYSNESSAVVELSFILLIDATALILLDNKDQISNVHDSIISNYIYSSLFRMQWQFFFKAKSAVLVSNEIYYTQFSLW